mmetsp:Transcript_8471/g.19190  ORF Transcript_8471/g.19190 Transcript_8471/m.19190 type:complete len:128 (-) Transcript_8471:11-394(-)
MPNIYKKSGQIIIPSWVEICKSSCSKKNSPSDSNWIFKRMASIVIKFYIYRQLGINQLRKMYSSKKRNKNYDRKSGSGKIIRFSINQLEKMKILSKNSLGKSFLTKKAQNDIDTRSAKLIKFINSNK